MVGGEGTSNRNFGGKDLVPSYLIFGWFLPVDGPRRTSFSFPHLACNGRRDLAAEMGVFFTRPGLHPTKSRAWQSRVKVTVGSRHARR